MKTVWACNWIIFVGQYSGSFGKLKYSVSIRLHITYGFILIYYLRYSIEEIMVIVNWCKSIRETFGAAFKISEFGTKNNRLIVTNTEHGSSVQQLTVSLFLMSLWYSAEKKLAKER